MSRRQKATKKVPRALVQRARARSQKLKLTTKGGKLLVKTERAIAEWVGRYLTDSTHLGTAIKDGTLEFFRAVSEGQSAEITREVATRMSAAYFVAALLSNKTDDPRSEPAARPTTETPDGTEPAPEQKCAPEGEAGAVRPPDVRVAAG